MRLTIKKENIKYTVMRGEEVNGGTSLKKHRGPYLEKGILGYIVGNGLKEKSDEIIIDKDNSNLVEIIKGNAKREDGREFRLDEKKREKILSTIIYK